MTKSLYTIRPVCKPRETEEVLRYTLSSWQQELVQSWHLDLDVAPYLPYFRAIPSNETYDRMLDAYTTACKLRYYYTMESFYEREHVTGTEREWGEWIRELVAVGREPNDSLIARVRLERTRFQRAVAWVCSKA